MWYALDDKGIAYEAKSINKLAIQIAEHCYENDLPIDDTLEIVLGDDCIPVKPYGNALFWAMVKQHYNELSDNSNGWNEHYKQESQMWGLSR